MAKHHLLINKLNFQTSGIGSPFCCAPSYYSLIYMVACRCEIFWVLLTSVTFWCKQRLKFWQLENLVILCFQKLNANHWNDHSNTPKCDVICLIEQELACSISAFTSVIIPFPKIIILESVTYPAFGSVLFSNSLSKQRCHARVTIRFISNVLHSFETSCSQLQDELLTPVFCKSNFPIFESRCNFKDAVITH